MKPTQDKYPHFEANQVLTNSHLNQVFDYLDEQERLTRANLIGIGIVCGLEFSTETSGGVTTIKVTKGSGIGSAGYLLIQPEDSITLVSYREYILPNELDYPQFKFDDAGVMKQFPLWEMFPAGEPNNPPALGVPAGFLNDKAYVLFLELRKEGLRNCSPNDCNDKGTDVTATLRHLLIRISDLEKILTAANKLQGNLTLSDLGQLMLSRINLPDIKMPRWDVPASSPVTSLDVLQGFHNVFISDKISEATSKALSAAYLAFSPLLSGAYPNDPFAGFAAKFGFLDNTNIPVGSLKFIQYYHGFFEDLHNAYDEFRWKGVELMCACCPPEDLFPRHLVLGLLNPSSASNPELFRNHFMPSPSISNCEEQTKDLRKLFMRLVEMTVKFTITPPLPPPGEDKSPFRQIRITPDKLSDIALSEKAIPYYYLQSGPPYLFQLWNNEKTKHGRASQNLGYRSDEYMPAAPSFVLNPLRYDLEPYNFLRIEGHLGLNYQAALGRILSLKNKFRLPIQTIALRTGNFDENSIPDANNLSCNFDDLEALYDSRIGELIGFLGSNLRFFYDIFYPPAKGLLQSPAVSKVKWFAEYDPNYRVKPTTMGAYIEITLWSVISKSPYFGPDDTALNILEFIKNSAEELKDLILIYVIFYIIRFPEILSENLGDLELTALVERENHLTKVAEALEIKREQIFTDSQQQDSVVKWEDLDDRLEAIVYGHYSDSIKALIKEFKRRITDLAKKQYLGNYLVGNPGIQHKAGVPLGGTFILVYHGEEQVDENSDKPQEGNFTLRGQVVIGGQEPLPGVAVIIKGTNQAVTTNLSGNFVIQTKRLPVTLRISTPGFRTFEKVISKEDFYTLDILSGENADKEAEKSSDFSSGEVIADFYLPYQCTSDCSPVQFVLPVIAPSFDIEFGCTGNDGIAKVIISPVGGTAPYRLRINNGNFKPIVDTLPLSPGEYTFVIQDAAGVPSVPQTITVSPPLTLGQPNFDCIGDNNQYVAVIDIKGGTPPYTTNIGKIINNTTFFGESLAGDTDIEIIITDSRKCTASVKINHSCGPELSFTAKIGCTSTDDFASAEIIASGGKSPYEVQVGTGPFVPLDEAFLLPAGKHTIIVRDAAGTLAAEQKIEIPGQIILGEPNFDCIGDNNEYVATFRIAGGLPPYTSNRGNVDGNTFFSDALPGNTDVEIIITDSRGCQGSVTVTHSCIADLSFDVQIGCTSVDGVAQVEIIPSGGTAPYQFQVGTAPLEALSGPLSLQAGTYQLTLADSSQSTASQTVTIPEALTLTVLKLSCETDNKAYRASIRINGGTAPYIASGVPITGNTFTTDLIASGQGAKIQVIDAKKCRTTIEVQHSCDKPCDLPCEGQTRKCAYRLWLQPPNKGTAYRAYNQLKEVRLRFNGKDIEIPGSTQLLQIPVADLNSDFENVMAKTIGNLNEVIQKSLTKEMGKEGKNRLVITYEPTKEDPFGILWIEYFVCETFNLEFEFNMAKPSPGLSLRFIYANETDVSGKPFNGTITTNIELNTQTMVPAFDCQERNLCKGSDFVKLCKESKLKPEFFIEPLGNDTFIFQSTTDNQDVAAWVWDVQNSISKEPFYEGEKVEAVVLKPNGVVRLTVINEKGCFAFVDKPF